MYINTSNEFDNLIRDSGRTFHAKIVNGADVIDDICSVSLYQASNSADNIGIGGCIASYIECKIGTTVFELENVEYELQIGLELSDKTVEYVPIGLFTPNKPSIQGEITSFIAYDRVKKLSGAYFSNIENYPTDSKNVLAEISQMTGVPIDYFNLDDGVQINLRTVMTDVTVNADGEEVQSDTYEKPFTGYTYQEAIAYIAQLHGKFAQVNRSGSIVFKWFNNTESQLEITRSQYLGDMQLAEKEFVLGVIHCSGSDGDLVCGAGAIGISIDNPVMTQPLLENVYNKIGGFKCRALTLNYNGDIRLDIGDIVNVYTQTGVISAPIMKMETIYDGGIHQVIHVFGDTDSTEPSKGPTAQRLDRMYSELLLVKEVMANKISAEMLKVRIAEMGYASIDELSAEVAKMGLMTAEEADIKYANIDFSNVKVESVGQLFADVGLIEDLTIVDGKVTGMLSSVKINADVITTGTLAVDRLLVTGENSIVYQINVDSSGLSEKELEDEKYQKYLNGTDIVANSITSTQIAAKAITADKIEAGAVTAEKIDVLSLSAISANLGTVTAGVIQSENYDSDSTGMKLDLTTGIWDSRYFKLSKEGKIKATAGVLGCFELTETGLNNSVLKILSNGSNTARFSIYDPTMANPVFDVEMSHPADNSAWTHFNIINMNEIVLSADDVYLGKNVWLTNDVSTEDGITLRTLSKTKVNQISPILYSPHFKWAIGAGTSPAIDESYPQVQLRQTGSAGAYSLSLVYYESSASRVFNEIINKNGNFLPNCLKTTGGTMTGEIISTSSNGFRIANRYGVLIRNDGSNTYLLLTNSGNASGTFNALRPFVVNNDTGEVTLGQDTTVKGILTASGKVRLTGNVNSSYIYNNTSSSSANVYIGTSYNFCRSTSSSKRYKHDITTILCEELRPEQLYDIDVVQYKYDADYLGKSDIRHLKDVIGFIAEDIYEKYRIAANYSIDEETGEVVVEDWDARYIIPAMLKLIQEQHERIKKLENNQ